MRFVLDDSDDSLTVQIQEGVPVANTRVLADGRVLALDAAGRPIGLKMLGVSERWPMTRLFLAAITAELARLAPEA